MSRRSTPARLLIGVLLLLAGAELTARLFPHRDAYPTQSGFVDPDPDLIWRLTPQASGPLATNALGLRDTTFKADADVKILILGDSVSWGHGVHDVRKLYASVLERELFAERPGTSFEVINAGVPGYSTFQELRYLQLYGIALDPDVVVLQFCLNDVYERYAALAEYGGNNYFLGVDTRRAVRGFYGWLLRHSRIFEVLGRWLQSLARDYEAYTAKNIATNEPSPEIVEAWDTFMAELDEVRRVSEAHEMSLIVLIAPYLFQTEDPAGTRQPQDRLIAYARRHGLPYVDLLPYFTAAGGGTPERLFVDPGHFSPDGHALTAQVLVSPVLELIDRRRR